MVERGSSTVPTHPVQKPFGNGRKGQMPQVVTLKAYEVYRHVYSDQDALITGNCRGGFSVGELIAFLYASGFPRSEWSKRTQEAFQGMDL